ncbi:MAG: tyrosine-type recombinase/integrase [Acidilobaceae archaeon]
MVDPSLVDFRSLGDEVRFRIFDYLWGRGVGSSELGVDPTYANKIKNRRARVSNALLERMLRMLSVDEFAMLVGSSSAQQMLQQPTIKEPQSLGEAAIALEQHVKALELVLEKYPQLSNIAYQKLVELLKSRVRGYSVAVTREHVEAFEKLLKSKAPKTREERVMYLRRALNDLDWELSAERLQEYIAELSEESPHVARHIAVTLKAFIKHMIKDPNLYSAFKTPRVEYGLTAEPLTLEEVRAVARAIEWPPAKAYFALLAETGLRSGEVLNARVQDLDLNERMLKIMKAGNSTKRSYIAFFSVKLRDYLRDEYLPYRDEFIEVREASVRNLLKEDVAEWRTLLFPFKDSALRSTIYDAMDRALGRRFRLYDLRAFYASYMSLKGVPGQIIDLLQGRVPPREYQVLARHYLAVNIRELRDVYDRAELTVLE